MTTGDDVDTILISDEEELQDVFENEDYDNPEQELDFSQDFHAEDGGHIYESIEDEVGEAADAAAVEDVPGDDVAEDDPDIFDDDLPESFFANL